MRDNDRSTCPNILVHALNRLEDDDAGAHVQRAGRSSQSSTSGRSGDGSRDGDALLFSARQLRGKRPIRAPRFSAGPAGIGSLAISVISPTFSAGRQAGNEVVELENKAERSPGVCVSLFAAVRSSSR